MKKTLLVILVLFAAVTAKAQWYVGCSLNGEFLDSYNNLNINPDFGYTFENAPIALGLATSFGFRQEKLLDERFHLDAIYVTPYLRYYFYEIDRFSFFTDLIGDIGAFGDHGWDVGLTAGVTFDLTEHWSAEFNYGWIGYEHYLDKGFTFNLYASTAKFTFNYNF